MLKISLFFLLSTIFFLQNDLSDFNRLDKKIVRKILSNEKKGIELLFDSIRKIRIPQKQDSLNARVNHLQGSHFYDIGKYDKSMKLWIKSIKNYEVIKDSLAISKLYNNMSLILNNAKKYKESLSLKKKALLYCPASLNARWNTTLLHNIGYTYYYLKEIDSSYKYVNLSYLKAIKLKDSVSIGTAINTLSESFINKRQYNQALIFADSVQNTYRKFVSQYVYENSLYFSSVAYFKKGDYNKALQKANKSLKLILKNGMLINAAENYTHISKIHQKKGDFKKAFEALINAKKFNDSIFNINQQKIVLDLEKKYKTEKKEKENLKLKQESALKDLSITRKNNFILISSLFFVIIILSLISYQLKKIRKKNKALQISILNRAKAERQLETVRDNISKDFHDDLGNRLARIATLSDLILTTSTKRDKKDVLLALKNIKEDSDILYSGTRDFMFSLKSKSDYTEELFTYLSDFGEEFYQPFDIDFFVKKDLKDNLKLPYYWNRQIILIFKEVMTNVAKHSKAKKVILELLCSEKEIEISLLDDGCGFDIEKIKRKNGLLNIKNRALKINAELLMNSEEGKTIIKLKATLP